MHLAKYWLLGTAVRHGHARHDEHSFDL